MAEPVTRKIDMLPDAITVANNDRLIVMDVSESAVDMTKKMTMSQIPISLASQLGANVVENAKIKDGAVTNSKLGADAVDGAKIADNAIGNEHIRDSTALSVIGRSSSTSGNPADIAAGTDGYVLRRSGTTLGFGTIATAGIATGAVTNSKLGADAVNGAKIADNAIGNEHIRDSAALSVIGRSSSTSGNPADIVAGADDYVLRRFGTTLGFGTVATDGIRDGAVTPDKLSIPYIPNATNIELGNLRTSSGSAYIDFHSYYPLNDYDARILASGGGASTNAKGTLNYSAVSHVFNGNLSVSGEITGAKHVVYMQLFLPDEAIITASGRSQFFVPSYLAGGKVKQLGIGIVSASTPSVTVALGSSYGSVSGTSSTETADTLNYTLPSARTKIPINVTCGAGTAPKGLDFWFVVLK